MALRGTIPAIVVTQAKYRKLQKCNAKFRQNQVLNFAICFFLFWWEMLFCSQIFSRDPTSSHLTIETLANHLHINPGKFSGGYGAVRGTLESRGPSYSKLYRNHTFCTK